MCEVCGNIFCHRYNHRVFSFVRTSGPALTVVHALQGRHALRGGKIEIYGDRTATRLIIGIGQMHPVLRGKFWGFQSRKIAKVQAWIFGVCEEMVLKGVCTFGQEGYSAPAGTIARIDQTLLQKWGERISSSADVPSFLQRMGRAWRRALMKGEITNAHEYALALNALSVLQVLYPRVSIFPIEEKEVHQRMGAQLDALHAQMEHVELSPAFAHAKSKQGRGLTQEEYAAVQRFNALAQLFQETLSHPLRDEAIFSLVVRHADTLPITVFVLGQAHKAAQRAQARAHLPSDCLCVWITPPQLWMWQSILRSVGLGVAVALMMWMLIIVRLS